MGTLDAILAFLADVGIPAAEGPVPAGTVLPGIRLVGGALVYDRAALRWPGDLLHEAGHVAVTPAALRPLLSDALEEPIDAPHAGEVEATAWAYAATVRLGLPAAVLFHDGGYRGHAAGLVATFGLGVYPGAFGLARAGMTRVGDDARLAGVPPYPHMTRWLRE